MTEQLAEAIAVIRGLPDDEQDAVAMMIFAYLSTDRLDLIQDR
jgi:hypothetical protein